MRPVPDGFTLAEANLDVAAKQGTIGAVVPILRQACGAEDSSAVDPPV